ncbi:MAG: prepilin-type N-terminal cleavage/methylation domain-containing protein [Candidatus Hydrogenedentes bacterium]|nr:prepilin-type N-terminal cleavage/methylation domain-containing protein [Candidatus Hydrogenedentota bacterium]
MKMRQGFTLVELLVATTMLVLLTTGGFAVLNAGMRAGEKSKRYNAMAARGQAALQSMANDIRAAILSEEYFLVSLDEQYEGLDSDTIDFVTAKLPRFTEEDSAPVGRCEVGYYIENDPDTDYAWLLRREDPSMDEDPLEGGAVTLAGPYVAALNLEFYDGLYWQSGWDDEEELPVAVYIQITVVDEDEIENPLVLETTVPVMGSQ